MKQASQLLTWFWWRHRVLIATSVIAVLIAQAVYWAAVSSGASGETLRPATTFLHCSFFIAFGSALTVFTFGADLDLTSGKSSIPIWLQSLPVSSQLLCFVPMLAMIVALTWAWLPYQLAMLHFYDGLAATDASGIRYYQYLLLIPLSFFFVLGFGFQATGWFPFRFAVYRFLALFATGYAFIFFLTRIFQPLIENEQYNSIVDALLSEGSWQLSLFAIGAVAVSSIAAVSSGFLSRHHSTLTSKIWAPKGNPFGTFAEAAREFLLAESPNQQQRFESRIEALNWRDWKQLGQYPCWLMLCFGLLAVTYRSGIILLPIAIVVCVFSGSTLGKNRYWKGSKPFSSFLGTLPVSNGSFLLTRYMNAYRVAMTCWGIASLGFLTSLLDGKSRGALQASLTELSELCKFDPAYGINVLAATLLLSFLVTLAAPYPGMVVGLSGRRVIHLATNIILGIGFFAGWLAFGMGLLYLNVSLDKQGTDHDAQIMQQILSWFFFALCVGLAVKFLVAASAVLLQMRRGILQTKPIIKYGLILLAGFIAIAGVFWWLLHKTNISLPWIALCLANLVPFPSLLLAPVSLDWNRHR